MVLIIFLDQTGVYFFNCFFFLSQQFGEAPATENVRNGASLQSDLLIFALQILYFN